jgi:hypothetical protein
MRKYAAESNKRTSRSVKLPVLFFYLGVAAVLMPRCVGQDSMDRSLRGVSVWIFNFRDSPLQISISNPRAYNLTNKSNLPISQYRLGCVQLDKDREPKIIYEMATEEVEILPGKIEGVEAFHHNSDRNACDSRSAKLSVVAVKFASGKEWRAQDKKPN